MTPEREAVLKMVLEAGRPITGKEIAGTLKKKPGTIRKMLFILKEAGQVNPAGYGLWIAGGNASGNASVTLPVTVATDPELTKNGNASRKAVTVSGNALKPGRKAGQSPGDLPEAEKARIALNREQNRWNAKNREKKREYNRKWRKANLEKAKACQRKWKRANPERVKIYTRKWKKANPDKVKAGRIKHYAKKYDSQEAGQ